MQLEEWKEWLNNSVTKEWFKFLIRTREQIKEEWANSAYVGEAVEESVQRNAAAIGQVKLLKLLEEVTFEDIEESKSE